MIDTGELIIFFMMVLAIEGALIGIILKQGKKEAVLASVGILVILWAVLLGDYII